MINRLFFVITVIATVAALCSTILYTLVLQNDSTIDVLEKLED